MDLAISTLYYLTATVLSLQSLGWLASLTALTPRKTIGGRIIDFTGYFFVPLIIPILLYFGYLGILQLVQFKLFVLETPWLFSFLPLDNLVNAPSSLLVYRVLFMDWLTLLVASMILGQKGAVFFPSRALGIEPPNHESSLRVGLYVWFYPALYLLGQVLLWAGGALTKQMSTLK